MHHPFQVATVCVERHQLSAAPSQPIYCACRGTESSHTIGKVGIALYARLRGLPRLVVSLPNLLCQELIACCISRTVRSLGFRLRSAQI